MFHIKKGGLDESITIYPFRNDITSRLEFQESVVKLALKTASFQQQTNKNDNFNFLFVASTHVESETSLISLMIEQFDKGQKQFNSNQNPTLVPTAPIPDAIYIPARLIYQASLNDNDANSPIEASSCEDLIGFYTNSVKYLANYFDKFCTSIESITKIMSLSSSIYFNNVKNSANFNQYNTILNATFEMVTLSNCFDASRIQPIPIIETSLLKTLQTTSNFFLKPKTGYCALYKNENIILLMDSEPKAAKVPLMGIWVSGVQNLNHPLTWAACIRYVFSSLLPNKSAEFQSSFVIILFSSTSKRPEYYLCKPIHSNLEFTLFSGFSKLVINKTNNENRCISIDMAKVNEGYGFKLFSNSVSQHTRQDIYGQHLLLNPINQSRNQQIHNHNELMSSRNQYHIAKSSMPDHDIQPRSLSASVGWNNNPSGNGMNTSSDNKTSKTNPVNFTNLSNNNDNSSKQFKTSDNFLNSNISSSNSDNAGNNVVVGSYHSVSDISVLSDNDIDDSIFSNSLNATTCSSMQNNSGSQNSSSNNYNYMPKSSCNYKSNNPPMVSQSDDFEFLRPKDPPMPTKPNLLTSSTSRLEQKIKYNQYVYSCTSNSLSCSSNGDSMSSLSPSPTPSFSNSTHALPSASMNQSGNLASQINTSQQAAFQNNKSILFGIPRDHAPMPTIPAENYHHSIDSPFVDVTLNSCDDMSLYQPVNKPQVNSRAALSPLLEPEPHANIIPKTVSSIPQPSNQFKSSNEMIDPKSNPNMNMNTNMNLKTNSNTNLKNSTPMMNNEDLPKPNIYQNLSKNSQNLTSASTSSVTPAYSYNQTLTKHTSVNSSIQSPNGYDNNNTSSNEFSNHDSEKNQSKQPVNNLEMLNYLHPNEIADQLMNSDEQLQSHLIEMQRLQETMNSLNLINQKQQLLNNSTTPSSYNTQNNNSDISKAANEICLLSRKIEERKNIIKVNFFHSYENFIQENQSQGRNKNANNTSANSYMHSNLSTSNEYQKSFENSFNTSIEKQRLSASNSYESGSSQFTSIVYPVSNKNNSNFVNLSPQAFNQSHNSQQAIPTQSTNTSLKQGSFNKLANESNKLQLNDGSYFEAMNHQQVNLRNSDKNEVYREKSEEESDLDENEDNEHDDEENVFGAALNNIKQHWNQGYQSQGPHDMQQLLKPLIPGASSINEDQNFIQKFNYVSLLLDDYCDKNTSLNTKALAHKYLKDQGTQPFSSQKMSGYKYETGNSEMFNSCYLPATSTTSSIMLEPSKYEKLFQYYTENPANFSMLDENEQKMISMIQSQGSCMLGNNMNMNSAYDNTNSVGSSCQLNNESSNNTLLSEQKIKAGMNQAYNGNDFSNNFPSFPTNSSSDCNLSNQYNLKKKPTSTPRFNSFESNRQPQNKNFEQFCDSENFNASNSYGMKNDSRNKNSENSDRNSCESDDADSESNDDEIWLFRKPCGNPLQNNQQASKPHKGLHASKQQPVDAFKESLQKLKQRKRLEREKRREEDKDFSDQDEPDRDVTTVLNIERLKRLPKLL